MTTAKNKLLTAEDLLRLYSQGVKGELIDGVLRETVAAGRVHARIAGRIITAFNIHVLPRRLGEVGGTDGGVLIRRNPDTVREPDIYFVSAERLPPDDQSDGYLEIIPDLVVEIISPSDSRREVNNKTRMWLSNGVLMVVEVYPRTRTIAVHRPGIPPVTLAGDDALDGGGVLPGFSLPLSEIFDA